MPQLDISFYIPQMFWLCIVFGSLYLLMTYVVLPRLERTLKARDNALHQLRSRAEELDMEVERLRRLNASRLKGEHSRALEQISEYTQKWQKEATQREFELQTLMHKRLDELHDSLQDQQKHVLQALKEKEKELVALVVAQLTGVTPTKQTITKALRKTQNHDTIH